MIDFCKHIYVKNVSFSDLRKKFHEDLEKIYKKIGKRVISEPDMIKELKKMGWSDSELARAHLSYIPEQTIKYTDGGEIYK